MMNHVGGRLGAVDEALERGIDFLHRTQKADGSWTGYCPGGPFSTCMTMIVEGYLEVLSKKDAAAGVEFLRRQQNDDGSFVDYPFAASGSLDATAIALAALKTAGVADTDPAMVRADAFVAAHGGFESCIPPNKVLLALAGLVDPKSLSRPLLIYRLLPGVDKMACKRMAVFMWVIFNAFNTITDGLRHPGQPSFWRHPIRALARSGNAKYFSRVQCPDGNWNGVIYTTLLGILTLHFAGVSTDDPRIVRALSKIQQWKSYSDEGLEVIPFGADIWNTSVAVRAMLLHGASATDANVARGLKYLYDNQPTIPGPKHWQNPPRGIGIVGGWPFMPGNPFSPDLDSTGDVLWTLGLALKKGAGQEIADAAHKGMAWLVPMQNRGGGWAGYTHNQRDKPAGPIFTKVMQEPQTLLQRLRWALKPPPEMLDSANADITGRVLCTLQEHGFEADHPAMRGGVRFLRSQLWSNDLWWGRWEVNYLFGSAYALSGLAAAGIELDSDEITRCSVAVLKHQNEDGGWGETIDTYLDPAQAGIGPSSAAATGRVLAALVETNCSDQATLEAAVDYLCASQHEDGSWRDDLTMWVVMPPAMYYINPVYTQYLAIEGLVRFRQAIANAV